MRRRLLPPAVLGVLALISGAVAVIPLLQEPGETAAGAEPTTPVFSLRRVPGALSRTIASGRLSAALDAILSPSALGRAQDHTCLAVHDPEGRVVFQRHTTTSLIPASTTKVLTAAAVLARLGPDARFTTAARAANPPEGGSVGDLWLVGSGDPLLATADYASQAGWLESPRLATPVEALADGIAGAGVRRIDRIVGDESRYDTQRYIPSWEPSYAAVPEVGPQSALNVNDGYAQWEPGRVAATSPAANAAAVLANQLRARNVAVGAVGEGKAPESSVVVASVESPPMTEVVSVILQHSGNLASELLVKELGARFGGAGTTDAGLRVLRDSVAAMGVPLNGFQAVDGSGLDRSDRLTCDLLQGVLARSGEQGPLARGMPVAGESGTLIQRFRATPAVGKVRAKTGSLDEVIGLAGWATGGDGRSLQFSFVANELPYDDLGFALQNQLATALVAYPQAPAADEMGPEAPRPPAG